MTRHSRSLGRITLTPLDRNVITDSPQLLRLEHVIRGGGGSGDSLKLCARLHM